MATTSDISALLKCLGEDTRLRILRLVSTQELSVNELMTSMGLAQPRVSRHLAVLRREGLVRDRREGNLIYYRMTREGLPEPAEAVWQALAPVLANGFFPEDLVRLRQTLARRADRSRGFFDDILAEWDRIRHSYIDDALPPARLAELVEPEWVVADVGTGTGQILLPLARRAREVVGMDRSERMLAVCRQRVEAAGLSNVTLRRGEAEALPLPDTACDAVFSSMLMHYLADPGTGLREMARILRPGGRLVVSDLIRHDQVWTREVLADMWLGFSEQQVRRWLAEAGLRVVDYSSNEGPAPAGKLATFVAIATKKPSSRGLERQRAKPAKANEGEPNGQGKAL